MASLTTRPNGHRWIQYVDQGGKRQTIRLGKVSKRAGQSIKSKVESLIEAKLSGCSVDPQVATWLGGVDTRLHERLVKLGLAKLREDTPPKTATTIGEFIEQYISKRVSTRKPNTLRHLRTVQDDLVDHFGVDRDMSTVTKADAEEFRIYLGQKGLAKNTINRRIGRAKQYWSAAADAELLDANPFKGQDCQVRPVESRFVYVEDATVRKVLDVADIEWRLIVALCRFAGFRCPSEVLSLKWTDINWAEGKMLVTSSKTEHHQGKGQRWVPIFERLRPYLEEAFENAADGAVFVIARYRSMNANLRTQLGRLCRQAGVDLWEKPFQNLRSSAEIDLNRAFPQHVVASWLGHSESVALKHYLRTTDADFRRAAGLDDTPAGEAQAEAANARNPKQKAKQHAAAPIRIDSQAMKKTLSESEVTPNGAAMCEIVPESSVPPQGLEP